MTGRSFPLTAQQRRDARARRWSAAVGAVACTGFGAVLTLIVQAVA